MLVNNLVTPTCLSIFQLIKFMCFGSMLVTCTKNFSTRSRPAPNSTHAHPIRTYLHSSVGSCTRRANVGTREADCEIFQSESSPHLMKLNPIQSWSAKFLKIISPIQSWFANVKSCSFILPHEAKELLELFCLQPNTIGWRQNSYWSAFASWGKIGTAFCHFQNWTRKCLLGIRGKSTAGVILPLGEFDCLDWSSDKDNVHALA